MSEALPERLRPLLDHQLAFEHTHLECLRIAATDDTEALERARAARTTAMWALIAARKEAGAAGAEDRDALKKAAIAVLADEGTST
ncbi:hypothetical protein ACIRL2_46025 [Embleya sp. NPDC127516]|uniref:hypothetical protein n=1 Tax=Embleya sp. NPDC127516 TaxID=3363990 RepID=UPI0038076C08